VFVMKGRDCCPQDDDDDLKQRTRERVNRVRRW
jgi:hypothetical protein